MARYLVHVRTPMPPAEAFSYMADLTNFADWDPGVDSVEQVEGDGAGPGAAFDVAVKLPIGTMRLRYDTIDFDDESTTMTAFAENALLRSEDTITVVPDGDSVQSMSRWTPWALRPSNKRSPLWPSVDR